MSSCDKYMATLPPKATHEDFEQLYIGIREQEQRLYTDEALRRLPDITPTHIHAAEWKIRKQAADRLIRYLRNKRRPLHILEIGCGNGWLAARLADIPHVNVTAMDINQLEVEQAARVFKKENLRFIADSFSPKRFPGVQFDVVVFAASLQYFSPLKEMLQQVQQCLTAGGEIHITDTKFYTAAEVAAARERSIAHFREQGFPGMADYYFHHRLEDLEGFSYEIRFDPKRTFNRLFSKTPFYWICINR